MVIRPHETGDYESIRHIYGEAFRRPESPGAVPWEVGLFDALCEAGDVIPELSFTALTEAGAVGHVTASKAAVETDSVVAAGPIGVLPEQQGIGIGSALMEALLTAADSADVPLIVLLGSPRYYGRFGFEPAAAHGIVQPLPDWAPPEASQILKLAAYRPALRGRVVYPPAFDGVE